MRVDFPEPLTPVTADRFLSERLQIEPGAPLLQFDNLAYDIDNKLIMYSREFYADGFFKHMILRKKI